MAINENHCNFIVFNYKGLQTIIAIITADKVTKLLHTSDDFCFFFNTLMGKYTLKVDKMHCYHCYSTILKD